MGRCKLDCPDGETECCICCTKQDSCQCKCDDIDCVNKQPTAYDVDKVVEQLGNRSVLARPVGWSKAYEIIMLKDAIEIVKEGGTE